MMDSRYRDRYNRFGRAIVHRLQLLLRRVNMMTPLSKLWRRFVRHANRLSVRVKVSGNDEVGRLTARCNAMAQALARSKSENEEVQRQLLRRNTELSVLNAIATTVSRSLELRDILDGALEEVLQSLKVKVGWILLKRDPDDRLTLAASKGFSEASPPEEIESVPEGCACRQTLAGGDARVVDGSPRCLRGGQDVLRREGLDCHASVPLKAKNKVLGIMNLAYPADRHFADADIQLLTSIGHQIGMAIDNARLYENLQDKEEESQRLLDKLFHAYEEERTRVARELHDEAGQRLTALLLRLGNVEAMLPVEAHDARTAVAEIESLAAAIVEEIRRIMMDLRPALLDHLGLIPAIRSFAEDQLQRAGVKCEIEVAGAKRKLPPSVEIALFRMLQEAITNIVKHAGAKTARVRLCFQESSVEAAVADDGCGFDPVQSRRSWQALGLLGMQERVALLSGTLRIDSQPGQGTRIALEIPTSRP